MSRNPGLGSTWIQKYHPEVYHLDQVISKGYPAPPPAYYDRYLKKTQPERYAQIKDARTRKGKLRADNNTPERLAIREEVLIAKHSRKTRNKQL